jgi:hypothetical protein
MRFSPMSNPSHLLMPRYPAGFTSV